jgi:hypothetical protein
MIKVYAELPFENFAMQRIVDAFKKYSPRSIEFVSSENEADLVIIYAYGHRRKHWWRAERLLSEGKKYAVVQLAIRSTRNPGTQDWLQLWNHAQLVWSYYDLTQLLLEDNITKIDNFYYAPLGVDSEVFKDLGVDRIYTIANLNNRDECVNEVKEAAYGYVFQLGRGINEDELVYGYNQSKFVSGLRRKEGFELPVIEGLLCGAKPIVFDRPETRQWFDGLALFINEGSHKEVVNELRAVFSGTIRSFPNQWPTDKDKELVKQRFNWDTIIKGFWERII